MKKLFVVFAILFIGVIVAGCTSQKPASIVTPNPTAVPTTITATLSPSTALNLKSIVDTTEADGRFTILITALKAAKLDETLRGNGTFTVFAPTDDAFEKLPKGTIATWLMNPQGQLKQILLYHVIDGNVMGADLIRLTSIKTLQGSNLNITMTGDMVKVNNANVTDTNIATRNGGVIHVIDAVLIPPTSPSPIPTPTYQ